MGFTKALELLPKNIRQKAGHLSLEIQKRAEEFRLRIGHAASVLMPDGEISLDSENIITGRDLECVMELATGASAYAAKETVRQGFVTVGGIRIGLCGTVIVNTMGEIEGIKNLTSICIRIPKQLSCCADTVYPKLAVPRSTLIISPPGAGKTSLLRELVRLYSENGFRVCLADERGEVAAVSGNVPGFDVGPRTDILTGALKACSIMMLLRAMNPDIIALDEITAPEDVKAIESASNCGVMLLATAHANSVEDLSLRGIYRELLEKNIFKSYVVIGKSHGHRSYTVSNF